VESSLDDFSEPAGDVHGVYWRRLTARRMKRQTDGWRSEAEARGADASDGPIRLLAGGELCEPQAGKRMARSQLPGHIQHRKIRFLDMSPMLLYHFCYLFK
jgi:hypothetical protein